MEQMNRIELRGNIGNCRTQEFEGRMVANFSVATNYVYKAKTGEPIIETTWHNVTAWESKSIDCLEYLKVGVPVYVSGRLRIQRFTGQDGTEKTYYEVYADTVEIQEEALSSQIGNI